MDADQVEEKRKNNTDTIKAWEAGIEAMTFPTAILRHFIHASIFFFFYLVCLAFGICLFYMNGITRQTVFGRNKLLDLP